MPKSLLFVESKPASARQVDEYHAWHEQTHIPEMLSVDGFVSARRWQSNDGNLSSRSTRSTPTSTPRGPTSKPRWPAARCPNPLPWKPSRLPSCAT